MTWYYDYSPSNKIPAIWVCVTLWLRGSWDLRFVAQDCASRYDSQRFKGFGAASLLVRLRLDKVLSLRVAYVRSAPWARRDLK